MGGLLVRKLVKPTKVFCPRAPHQIRLYDLLFPKEFDKLVGWLLTGRKAK